MTASLNFDEGCKLFRGLQRPALSNKKALHLEEPKKRGELILSERKPLTWGGAPVCRKFICDR